MNKCKLCGNLKVGLAGKYRRNDDTYGVRYRCTFCRARRRIDNIDIYRAYDRLWIKKRDRKKFNLSNKRHRESKPEFFIGKLIKDSRKNAIRYAWDHNINRSDLIKLWDKNGGKCAISSLDMSFKFNTINSVSIDRIDTKVGYIVSNIQLVAKCINFLKNDCTINEFNRLYSIILCPKLVKLVDVDSIIPLLRVAIANMRRSKINSSNITLDYIIELWKTQKGICAISGIPMQCDRSNRYLLPSIDRINPNLKYDRDNIQLVCRNINFMKNKHSNIEVGIIMEQIRDKAYRTTNN